jgi:hypothetical protein
LHEPGSYLEVSFSSVDVSDNRDWWFKYNARWQRVAS